KPPSTSSMYIPLLLFWYSEFTSIHSHSVLEIPIISFKQSICYRLEKKEKGIALLPHQSKNDQPSTIFYATFLKSSTPVTSSLHLKGFNQNPERSLYSQKYQYFPSIHFSMKVTS